MTTLILALVLQLPPLPADCEVRYFSGPAPYIYALENGRYCLRGYHPRNDRHLKGIPPVPYHRTRIYYVPDRPGEWGYGPLEWMA